MTEEKSSVGRDGATRRGFLVAAAVAGAATAGGYMATRHLFEDSKTAPDLIPGEPLALTPAGKLLDTDFSDPFAGGEYLGHLPFQRESEAEGFLPGLGRTFGHGHNARRVIDLASLLTPDGRKTPADKYYIRTEYPDQLEEPPEWTIKIEGEVKKPQSIPLKQLLPTVESQGPLLTECSSNAREVHFGLVSVGDWAGIPVKEIIKRARPTAKAHSVLFNGFDDDSRLPNTPPPYKTNSWPTCSWVFSIDQLLQANAFLATQLNGAPLPKDQGAPLRLVVPGWYGCVGAKWVNQIQFVDDKQPATLQMLEFASRTMQKLRMDETTPEPPGRGPELAREYRPAIIEQVAVPVRVEAWKLNGTVTYRVVGLTWGGPVRTEKLEIRFIHGNAPAFEPIQFCQTKTSCPAYGIWCHHFQPKRPGAYWIEMRVADRKIRSRKMLTSTKIGRDRSVNYYARMVSVPVQV
jgi:DMSO/TMAO reductase YedYZ molybdopterin-dependent catalytic subunit